MSVVTNICLVKAIHWLLLLMIVLSNIKVYSQEKMTYAKSYALVIGIDSYPSQAWPSLLKSVDEAEKVVPFLARRGFEVHVLYNEHATGVSIRTKLSELARKIKNNDRFVFYFAGHGHTEKVAGNEWGYIVPYNGTDNSGTFLSFREIELYSEQMNMASAQLFVLNSCFGGFRSEQSISTQNISSQNSEELLVEKSRQYIAAGGKDQSIMEGPFLGDSSFTDNIIDSVINGKADYNDDGVVTFSELAEYVLLVSKTKYQSPHSGRLNGHLLGDFKFSVKAVRSDTTAIISGANYYPGNSLGIEFVLISPGEFMTGRRGSNRPPRNIRVLKPFYIGKYEITQGQWNEVMGENRSFNKGDMFPVDSVSWNDAQEFIRRLNEIENCEGCYRLPTEAEWEFVAQKGWSPRERYLNSIAWYNSNSRGSTHPVGTKEANILQVHDMFGNVMEWVDDWYLGDFSITSNITGSKVLKGGAWLSSKDQLRPSIQYNNKPNFRYISYGFRIVREFEN